MRLLAVLVCGFVVACTPFPRPTPPTEREEQPADAAGDAAVEPGSDACLRIVAIEVLKSKRSLIATCASGRVVRFPVALGREPLGPKLRAGDQRTPEGEYRISGGPRWSRFHLFIPIDYPSPADAERALELGILDEGAYREILRAIESGEHPPQNSPLGGQLGFHGEGPRWRNDSRDLDWTYGCIALADDDIDFLARRVSVGTPVRVLP